MALKLEAGKYYRTRDGRKVGPVYMKWEYDLDHPWGIPGFDYSIADNGERWKGGCGTEADDLIAEWQDDDTAETDDAMTALQNAAIAFIRAGNYKAAYNTLDILRDESE